MIIFSHPTGNANVRNALAGLYDAQLLQKFHTTVAAYPGNVFDKLGQVPALAEFRRRAYAPQLAALTQVNPWKELGRIGFNRLGWKSLIRSERGPFSVDAVYHNQDRKVARAIAAHPPCGVYAYEDGAQATFMAATATGTKRLYELPTVYWRASRRILGEAAAQYPAWASTMQAMTDSEEKLARKDEELRMADHIFVASSFVAETLQEYPGELAPVHIIPYGFPTPVENRQYTEATNRPIKLLYVGNLSQRKGLAEMFAAVERFNQRVELTVVGRKPGTPNAALDAALARHHYIPSLPHHKVLELMRSQDALLFPALCEGFGLVVTEAMSQGTPVITNNRTAGRDLITPGEDGYLFTASSEDSLAEAIEKYLDRPQDLATMGRAASHKAGGRPWRIYQEEFAATVNACLA